LVAYRDRIFISGITESGKSQLARRLFLAADRRRPKMIIDPQMSDTTNVPGAVSFQDPRNVPRVAIARFVPNDPADLDAYNALYGWMLRPSSDDKTPAFFPGYVWCDEAGDVFPVRRTPRDVRRLLTHGRKREIGHIATHTRPRELDPNVIAQARHVITFDLPNPADRKHIADIVGLDPLVFAGELGKLEAFEYLWYDRRAKTLTRHPALKL
jgi:hypothetical protein